MRSIFILCFVAITISIISACGSSSNDNNASTLPPESSAEILSPEQGAKAWIDGIANQDGNKILKHTCLAQRENLQGATMWTTAFSFLGQTLSSSNFQIKGDISDLKFETVEHNGDQATVRVYGELRTAIGSSATASQVDEQWQLIYENETWRWCGPDNEVIGDQPVSQSTPIPTPPPARQSSPTPTVAATQTSQVIQAGGREFIAPVAINAQQYSCDPRTGTWIVGFDWELGYFVDGKMQVQTWIEITSDNAPQHPDEDPDDWFSPDDEVTSDNFVRRVSFSNLSSGGEASYGWPGITPNQTYRWRVAHKVDDQWVYSNVLTFTTEACAPDPSWTPSPTATPDVVATAGADKVQQVLRNAPTSEPLNGQMIFVGNEGLYRIEGDKSEKTFYKRPNIGNEFGPLPPNFEQRLGALGSLSPDGKNLLFFEEDPNSNDSELYLATFNQNEPLIRLTSTDEGEFNPSWAADGKQIVFSRGDLKTNPHLDIFLMSLAGGEATNIVKDPNLKMMPSISPNGKQVLFVAYGLEGSHICIVNLDDSSQNCLVQSTDTAHLWPTWSPNGSKIAFLCVKGPFYFGVPIDNSAVFIMNVDGSELTQLTDYLASGDHFARTFLWSPDGQQIAFRAIVEPDRIGTYIVDVEEGKISYFGEAFLVGWLSD